MKAPAPKNPVTCPCCNQGKLQPRVIDYEVEVQDGVRLTVPQLSVEICDHCGEIAIPAASATRIDQVIAEQNEQLTPRELERIREEMGLDQTEMSEVLGLGGKTYHRWERGLQVPSRSMGYYLRVLAEFHEVAAWLKERGWRRRNRINGEATPAFHDAFPDLAAKKPTYEKELLLTTGRRINFARVLHHVDAK